MTRTRWLLTALLAAISVALVAWLMRSIEWVDADVRTYAKGEAARDRFYVAKQLVRRLGASVTTARTFEQLPPPGTTLVLGSRHWNMFPGREAALRRWIDEGGHLVVLQSAWSTSGDTPRWVPMRSAPLPRHDGAAAAASAASAAAAEAASAAAAERFGMPAPPGAPCTDFFEPEQTRGAFGAPRHYRVCGVPMRLLRARDSTWLLAGADGPVALRVPYGRGDITANAIEGSFANTALLRGDGALALAAILQLQPGDRVSFVDEETRARFLALLWENGAPALWLAAGAILLLLWRGGARFGPLLADAPTARRSIDEQIRRTAAFIAGGGGAALHRASVRALDEEARRSIPNYSGLLSASERSAAIAGKTEADAASLRAAMSVAAKSDRHHLATAITRLERARRALLPGRHRSLHHPLCTDSSPP